MEYSKITNVEIDGVDFSDYPDFCDAYITRADYDGEPMTEEQLEEINEDGCFVHDSLLDKLF